VIPSRIPTPAEDRARYAALDRLDRMERMVRDIALGVPRERSAAVADAEDARAWDRLAAAEVEQLNANQIAALLRDTTRNHNGNWTPGMGYGVLDVQKAMAGMAAI
jgi:hypothetical protein